LYIQAYSLYEQGDVASLPISVSLLERCLSDFPPHVHVAVALHLKGRCMECLSDTGGALSAFRDAISVERRGRVITTDAYLDFAWSVATNENSELFAEALALLDEFADRCAFPVQRFRWHSSCALIQDSQGNHDRATLEARLALDAARTERSDFQFHRSLGLVEGRYADVQKRLHILVV
jgi:hypothetical protein